MAPKKTESLKLIGCTQRDLQVLVNELLKAVHIGFTFIGDEVGLEFALHLGWAEEDNIVGPKN